VGAEHSAARQPGVLRGQGDAEVGQLDPVSGGDQDVAGLDVTMHDAHRVGGIERVEDPQTHRRNPRRRQRPLLIDDRREGRSLHVLHHDVDDAVVTGRCDHVVHPDNAGMVQPTCTSGLTQSTLHERRRLALAHPCRGAQLLECHTTLDQRVDRQPHHAHPTPPEQTLQPIPPGHDATRRLLVRPAQPRPLLAHNAIDPATLGTCR